MAWRVADSFALRDFLGFELSDATPDHSTISRTRRLIDLETHEVVFGWVLRVLAKSGLLKGNTLGVDATTLEANAALRSIVRRDTGESYEQFLERLAKASGIETPTRADLARLDRKRKKKGSNDDWTHPHDPDAKITKMKDGRTHLAHKAEHAVDMDTGAIVAVTVQPADRGDTSSIETTLDVVTMAFEDVLSDPEATAELSDQLRSELVADKGYHSNAVLTAQQKAGVRTYISEPKRGRRNWRRKPGAKKAVYGNRRRIRGASSLWPSNSCTVRISFPLCSRCVARLSEYVYSPFSPGFSAFRVCTHFLRVWQPVRGFGAARSGKTAAGRPERADPREIRTRPLRTRRSAGNPRRSAQNAPIDGNPRSTAQERRDPRRIRPRRSRTRQTAGNRRKPRAEAFWPLAIGSKPRAEACWPLAIGSKPCAEASWPLAIGPKPRAEASWPLAIGPKPRAEDSWPLAIRLHTPHSRASRLVAEVRRQPALRLLDGHARALGVVRHLVATHLADGKVARLRV